MSSKTQQQLLDELALYIRSNGQGGETTAQDLRSFLASLITEITTQPAALLTAEQVGAIPAALERFTTNLYLGIRRDGGTAPLFYSSLTEALQDPRLYELLIFASHSDIEANITNTNLESITGFGTKVFLNGYNWTMPRHVRDLRLHGDGQLIANPNREYSFVGTRVYNSIFLDTTLVPAGRTVRLFNSHISNENGRYITYTSGVGTLELSAGSITDGDLFDPATTIIRESSGNNADSTILDFNFAAGYANSYSTTITASYAKTYTTQAVSNVTSVSYKCNNNAVSLPFSVAVGDTLQIIIVRAENNLGSVVSIAS